MLCHGGHSAHTERPESPSGAIHPAEERHPDMKHPNWPWLVAEGKRRRAIIRTLACVNALWPLLVKHLEAHGTPKR